MKLHKKIFLILTTISVVSVVGCKKILEETPCISLSQDYLASPAGILAAITGTYSDMHYLRETEGFSAQTEGGTDEALAGASAGGSSNAFLYKNLATTSNDYAPTFQISCQVIMFKFSDVYLIAAEAYFKAVNSQKSADMLNVLRARAAYDSSKTQAQIDADILTLKAKASDITLDFILDERTRELYGAHLRWWGLARTKTLVESVKKYNTEAATNIQDYHILRPTPQRQIDLVASGLPYPLTHKVQDIING